jgi:hypothetical protein
MYSVRDQSVSARKPPDLLEGCCGTFHLGAGSPPRCSSNWFVILDRADIVDRSRRKLFTGRYKRMYKKCRSTPIGACL